MDTEEHIVEACRILRGANILTLDKEQGPHQKGLRRVFSPNGFLKHPPPLSLQVADIYLASKYKAYAISGPTVQGGLPVFHWSRFNKTLHEGMPEAYNFDFITMKPIL